MGVSVSFFLFLLTTTYPIILIMMNRYTLSGLYEESLGYRYFYTLRQVYEPSTYLFLPQGQFTDIFHQQIQRILSFIGYPPTQLFPRIDLFSYISVFFFHLFNAICFTWAVTPLRNFYKIIAILFWSFAFFAPRFNGFVVLLQPDYILITLGLTLIAAGCYVRLTNSKFHWNSTKTLFLGVFFGVALATKITLVILPITVCLSWILAASSFRRSLPHFLSSIVIGGLVWFILLYVYYQNVDFIANYFHDLGLFIETGGGVSQVNTTWSKWLSDKLLSNEVALVAKIIYCTPFFVLASFAIVRSRIDFSVVIPLLVGSVMYHWFIFNRDYPGSMFESILYTELVLWGIMCVPLKNYLSKLEFSIYFPPIIITTVSVILVIYSYPTFNVIYQYINDIGRNTIVQNTLRDEQRKISGDYLWLVSSNGFRPVSIDSAIMKGGSGLHGWRNPDSVLIATMSPNVNFLFGGSAEFYANNPVKIERYSAIMFATYYSDLDKSIKENKEFFQVDLANFTCDKRVDLIYQRVIICERSLKQ